MEEKRCFRRHTVFMRLVLRIVEGERIVWMREDGVPNESVIP
jgi:hypothetical protein